MKKITFFSALLLFSLYSFGQCVNTFQYPGGDIPAVSDGLIQTISDANYSGDYSVLTGLSIDTPYEFSIIRNSDVSHGYVTIIDNTDGITVLAHGPSPLITSFASTDSVQLHWSNDNTCATDTVNHTTTYQLLTMPCINTFQYPFDDIVAVNNGTIQLIASDSYAGDYTVLTDLSNNDLYLFELTLNFNSSHGFVTIIDNADGTTVLDSGMSPFLWTATTEDVQLHWSNDNMCATDTEFHTTTYIALVPPENDSCDMAIPVNCSGTYAATTISATDTTGNGSKDVWYSFTGTGIEEVITLSTCGSTDFDTTLTVYDSCELNSDNVIAYNVNGCGNGGSYIDFLSDGASTYFIVIEGAFGASGNYTLGFDCSTPDVNNTCDGAIPVSCGGTYYEDNLNITDTVGDGINDLWYSYTGDGNEETVTLSLCGKTDFRSIVYILDSCDLSVANILAFDDDGCGISNGASEVSFYSDGVTTYIILIEEGSTAELTNMILDVSCTDYTGPSNNTCINAIPVDCNTEVAGTTVDATDTTGNSFIEVWYTYQGSGVPEIVDLNLCNNTNFNTYLTVLDDCGGSVLAYNDDICGEQSGLSFESDGFSTYYIMIDGSGSSDIGDFELALSCYPVSADECDLAEVIPLGVERDGYYFDATTSSGASPSCLNSSGFVDNWYQFVAPVTTDVKITTILFNAAEANVALYDDCNLNNEIACSANPGGQALEVGGLTSGNTYFIRVWEPSVSAPIANENFGGAPISYKITITEETLSVSNPDNGSFNYYPNPVTEVLTIKGNQEIESISVVDILGKEVLKTTAKSFETILSMKHLNSGMYLVTIATKSGSETFKIIKN